jgi:hypothetical protein
MDDQLLQDLYGFAPDEGYSQDDDLIKEAQAELVEAVADEAGIDLNEMDDEELEKFASYVLSPEYEEADSGNGEYYEESEDALYEEADQMGRVMAHAYADEQMKIASAMEQEQEFYGAYDNALVKVAHSWDMMKVAADEKFTDRSLGSLGSSAAKRVSKMTGYRDIKKALELAKIERANMRSMTPADLEAYKNSVKDTKAFKAMSKDQRRAMMLAEIKDPTGSKVVATGRKGGFLGFGGKQVNISRGTDAIARRQAMKNLALRGAGKLGTSLAVAGGLGYGINKLRNN